MNPFIISLITSILLALALLPGERVHASEKGHEIQPAQTDLENAVRALWERMNPSHRGDHFFYPAVQPLCIPLPVHPAPDAKSKAELPMAWHVDFYADTMLREDRATQLRQLDALAKVGLLSKSHPTTKENGKTRPITRYALTEKGWAASGYSPEMTCFAYGTARYLGIIPSRTKLIGSQDGAELYEVRRRSGLASETDLAPWARDTHIQAMFPEIGKNLAGQEFTVAVVRKDGKWLDYDSAMKTLQLQKSADAGNAQRPENLRISSEMKRQIDKLKALPAPTVNEIKKILETSHGVGQQDPWPIPCIDLPGIDNLPVDKRLSDNGLHRYAVAIFTDKPRGPYDRVANKTIPYLNLLERLGIVAKRAAKKVAGEGKDAGKFFKADIYTLTPAYKHRLGSRYSTCFPLGKPSIEFVDIQIAESDSFGFPNASFRYKLKVLYRQPPPWMTEPTLQKGWSELRQALENGMACEGEFAFDKKTRTKQSGVGSCWWAFDSYVENY